MRKLTNNEKEQIYGGFAPAVWLGIALGVMVLKSFFSDKGEAKIMDQSLKWDNSPSIDANSKVEVEKVKNSGNTNIDYFKLPSFLK